MGSSLEFIEACAPYWDAESLFSPQPNPTTKWTGGNMLLDTAKYFMILKILGHEFHEHDREHLRHVVDQCYREKGLLNRNYRRPDAQAHDDYVGVMAASHFVDRYHAAVINAYGLENHYCYDNTSPGRFSLRFWHARFPGQVAFYQMAAGLEPCDLGVPPWTGDIGLRYAIVHGGFSYDPSGIILDWLKIQVLKNQGDKYEQEIRLWEFKIRQNWGCMGRVFTAYHGERHPFACAMKGKI